MVPTAHATIIVGQLVWSGVALAQDTGIGARDARTATQQQDAIARARDTAGELAKLGAEHGGVAAAVEPFAKAAEAIADVVKDKGGEAARNAGELYMNSLIDSVQVNDAANKPPTNEAANDAANFAQQRVCEFYPDTCRKAAAPPAPSAGVPLPSYGLTPLDGGPR